MGGNSVFCRKFIASLLSLVIIILSIYTGGCAAQRKLLPKTKPAPSSIAPPPPSRVNSAAQPDYSPLKSKLTAYMAQKGGEYSFLLHDISSGGELAIEADKPIDGASTTKMTIALYLYHLASQGKLNLNDKVAYSSSMDLQGGAGALQFFAFVDGWKYRYRTLGNILITLSDNVAWNMLKRTLGVDNIAAYMKSLGGKVVYPQGQNITTARDMVTYFRAAIDFQKKYPDLGSLLINDMSNTIWDNDGIPGLLPARVQVAHKEGDKIGITNDAGIVYLKGRPYILAVLTRNAGANTDEGFAIIGDISRAVYDFQAKLPKVAGQ